MTNTEKPAQAAADTLNDFWGPVIHAYTRADAIRDGVLVEAKDQQGRGLFKFPVAYTASVYAQYVEWTEDDNERRTYQNQSGREWDLLWMMMWAMKSGADERSGGLFKFMCVSREDGAPLEPEEVTLKVMIGPDENGQTCITVMLPHED